MHRLTRLSLANRLVVALIGLAIVAFGLFGITALRQELIPSIDAPAAVVTAAYPGATPDLVAQNVAEPLEDALVGVKAVTKVRSTSATGFSTITVEWEYGEDGDDVRADIKTAVDAAKAKLPDDVDPQVLDQGSDDVIPVAVLSANADLPLPELTRVIDDLAVPKLEKVDGVREVQLGGQDVTRVEITLDNDKMRRYDLNAATVTTSVQSQLSSTPAGNSYSKNNQLTVEVGAAPDSLKRIRNIPVATPEKDSVLLSQLGTVAVVSEDHTTISRANQQTALSLSIFKSSDADSVEISHAVRAQFADLEEQIGHGARMDVVFDQSTLIEESLNGLATEGLLGLVFAVLVILAFLLSVRATIVTAISIPLSLLIALIGLWVSDFSLNLLTLAALTVAVGRVVDDSIVVIENIKRRAAHTRRLAMGDIVAAVQEVGGAVTASTVTTVVVFLPIGLVGGQSGELFRPFALTVAIALGASLLVALTIIPLLAFWIMRGPKSGSQPGRAEVDESEKVTAIQRLYLPVLRTSLRHPLLALSLAVVILVGTIGGATLLKTDFIGGGGDDRALLITQTLAPGTRLEKSSDAAKIIEERLSANADVATYLVGIGSSAQGGAGEPNVVSYNLTLKESVDADAGTQRLRDEMNALAKSDPAAGELIVRPSSEGWQSSDLTITVVGNDEAALRKTSEAILAEVKTVPDLINVESDVSDERPLLRIKPKLDQAADLGFTQADLGRAVAQALQGQKVGEITLTTDTDSSEVYVRTSTHDLTPKQVGNLLLPVSQLQQTKAINAATDRLKAKSDKLKDQNDELSDQQDALTDRQDALSDDQDAVGDDQEALGDRIKAQGERDADKADRDLVKSLKDARNDKNDAEDAMDDAKKIKLPPRPAPGVPGTPVTAEQIAYQQAAAGKQAAIAQAKGGVSAAKAGVDQLEDSLKEMRKQRRKQDKNSDDQQVLTDKQKAIGDDQKAVGDQQSDLGDLQKDIGDKQSDLADEQEDIKDIRAGNIRLKSVADVRIENAPTTVRHTDGDQAVTIKGTPIPDSDLGKVGTAFNAAVARATADLPNGMSLDTGGAVEEQAKSFRQLGLALLAAIALVFIVMVATFKSLVQPLIMVPSIIFAATGAVIGLLITNVALGVPAMIGILMLIGIVVTNAIVLIDLINHYRARGEDPLTAIVDGARLRLRPIVMTAAATIFALVPMGLGLTGGGVFISRPLAVVVIGGLISSTLATLVLLPIFYGLVTRSIGRNARQRWGHTQLPAPVLAAAPAVAAAGSANGAETGDAEDAGGPADRLFGDPQPAAPQRAKTNPPVDDVPAATGTTAERSDRSPWERPEDDQPTTIRPPGPSS